jgi:ssDNA-binding replication factor A large subunit
MAIYEDGSIYKDIIIAEDVISGMLVTTASDSEEGKSIDIRNIVIEEYYNKEDLNKLMYNLNRVYQDTTTLDFES